MSIKEYKGRRLGHWPTGSLQWVGGAQKKLKTLDMLEKNR